MRAASGSLWTKRSETVLWGSCAHNKVNATCFTRALAETFQSQGIIIYFCPVVS